MDARQLPALLELLLVLLPLASCNPPETYTTVTIDSGRVKGVNSSSYFTGKPYTSFYAIPYAEPPVGDLRFAFPEPVKKWEFVRDATRDGPACIQVNTIPDTTLGEEDCLWLSVYTPEVPSEKKKDIELKPVLVWIHGGRYVQGTGRESFYSPSYMMDFGDIVVVSVQYRLGVMGWLSTGDSVIPGNFGYHDQVLALKWIQNNIHVFGGDKNRVTISGQSAGGASVHSHMVSPLSRGLFHGIIAMSGCADVNWNGNWKNHKKIAKDQAEVVGCPNGSSADILNCLRTVDARTLTLSQSDLFSHYIRTPAKVPLTPYLPIVDPFSARPFFPESPKQSLLKGDYDLDIPVMMGLVTQEGAWYSVALMNDEAIDTFNEISIDTLNHLVGDEMHSTEALKSMYKHYFNDEKFGYEHRKAMASFFSDATFNVEGLHAAHLHTLTSRAPLYYYIFGFEGQWTLPQIYGDYSDFGGVAHLDDMRYVWRMPFKPNVTEQEVEVIHRFTGYIADFVRHGKPTGADHPGRTHEEWLPYTRGHAQIMNIFEPERSGMSRELPFPRARMQFWTDLFRWEEDWISDYAAKKDEL